MTSLLNKLVGSGPTKKPSVVAQKRAQQYQVLSTSYSSKEVNIPASFLSTQPYDAQPILTYLVDFEETVLPEYGGMYAVVLDNILSPSECRQFIEYAELSAGKGDEGVEGDGWVPALVNAGPGKEMLITDYRNSDRIIWDNQELMNRLWERCLQGTGIRQQLSVIKDNIFMQGAAPVRRGEKWNFTRLNERMRFLRYGPGQFFAEHCDGSYKNPDKEERSFLTLHLYLTDSEQAITPTTQTSETTQPFPPPLPKENPLYMTDEPLKGGATPFFSRNMKKRIDVDPRAGRVLIFQHRDLMHSGDYVTQGVKYTMRTDLMYEREMS